MLCQSKVRQWSLFDLFQASEICTLPGRALCARAACAFEYEALLARMLATPTPVSTLKRWRHHRR